MNYFPLRSGIALERGAPSSIMMEKHRKDLIGHFTRKFSPLCEDASIIEYLYPKQLENLKGTFLRCVLHSESNSMLVMGPKGYGKSVLVKAALKWLANEPGTKGE